MYIYVINFMYNIHFEFILWIIYFTDLGVIKKDPKLPDTIVMPPPTQRPEGSLFDDEDKSKVSIELLLSVC